MIFKVDSIEGLKDYRDVIGKRISRTIALDREAIDEKNRTVKIAFSSEFPVDRGFYIEVLDHDPANVDLSRVPGGMAFLLQHDPDQQIGVIEDVSIDPDRVGRSTVRISQTREDIWTDLKDGIRRNISVGYEILGVLSETKLEDGRSIVRFKWAPIEESLVAVPADYTVGVGRSLEAEGVPSSRETHPPEGDVPAPEATSPEGKDAKTEGSAQKDQTRIAVITPQQEKTTLNEEVKKERERIAKIEELSSKYATRVKDINSLRQKAVNEGLSEDQFRGLVLDNIEDSKPLDTPGTEVGLTEKEVKKFSLMRAIRSMDPRLRVEAPFEREVSDAIAKNLGKAPTGMFIPFEVQRAWNIANAEQGDNLVGQDYRPGSFIELLRNATFFSKAGVQYLPGLVGNLAIPRQKGAGQAYWCTETGAPTASSGSVDQMTLTPKTVGAYQDYTRLLMLQSSPAIEGIVRNDVLNILALAVEKAALHGSGSSNEPEGLAYNATVSASALLAGMAGFNATSSTDLEGVIADANYGGSLCYIMRPKFAVQLKSRPLIGTTYPVFVVANGSMNGYPVYGTANVESGFVFHGDFSQLYVGEWGTLDISVDTAALATTGGTRVIGLYNVDIGIRHAEAFTFGSPCS